MVVSSAQQSQGDNELGQVPPKQNKHVVVGEVTVPATPLKNTHIMSKKELTEY